MQKYNAKLQQLDNRIKFVNTDVDKYNWGKYDLVISNPPYIKRIKISRLEEDVIEILNQSSTRWRNDGYSKIGKVIKKVQIF